MASNQWGAVLVVLILMLVSAYLGCVACRKRRQEERVTFTLTHPKATSEYIKYAVSRENAYLFGLVTLRALEVGLVDALQTEGPEIDPSGLHDVQAPEAPEYVKAEEAAAQSAEEAVCHPRRSSGTGLIVESLKARPT